ncbi:MAG TPA: TIM barrel protein [Anaerolineae bacterium]|nr:TIM barrel protein [Anaerolineae bacterium]
MHVTVGSAPDSWGVWFPSDPKQTPWNRFLDEVAEAGYEWIELGPYGYLPTDPAVLRRELDKRGLKVTGTFVFKHLEDADAWDDIQAEAIRVGELVSQFGAKFMVLIDNTYSDLFTGTQIRPRRLDDDAWKQLVETTNRLGRLARERFGLTLVYHPHAETHVEYEDQIERLLQDTDPAYASLLLDTGHHAYRGGDPIAFMRKHHERIPYLHLKSVDPQMQKRVEAEKIPFAIAVAQDMFCEPSRGAVNFPAFRDMLKEIDFNGWGIVEQDMYPAPFDKPLPIAKRTRQYLREIGIG